MGNWEPGITNSSIDATGYGSSEFGIRSWDATRLTSGPLSGSRLLRFVEVARDLRNLQELMLARCIDVRRQAAILFFNSLSQHLSQHNVSTCRRVRGTLKTEGIFLFCGEGRPSKSSTFNVFHGLRFPT